MVKRILGVDPGDVRVGLALSDPMGRFAQPHSVLPASGPWATEVVRIAGECGAELIVVGYPVRTDGTVGPAAERAAAMAQEIRDALTEREMCVPVEFYDERFTSAVANQALIGADMSRKKRKQNVDKVAAAVMLQGYLDRHNR